MKFTPRAAAFAALGVGPLLLVSACGDSTPTGARATIANIQPTSFVEVPPATTTSTTTVPENVVLEEGTRSPVEQSYTIQANDNLFKIATMFDITVEQLVNYNQFANGIDQLILPGDEIKIPPDALVPGTGSAEAASGGDGESETETDTGDDTSSAGGCTHVIALNENPNRVAKQYDITFAQLQAANPAMDMTVRFVVGDEIIIPPEGNCD